MSRLARGLLASVLVVAAVAGPAAADALDDLLFDLQLVPLAGRTPAPFSLEALHGGTMTLAGLKGRPVLLYFWASW
jgi:hypothetical protein